MDIRTIIQNLQDLSVRLLTPEAFLQIGIFIGIIIAAYIPFRLTIAIG